MNNTVEYQFDGALTADGRGTFKWRPNLLLNAGSIASRLLVAPSIGILSWRKPVKQAMPTRLIQKTHILFIFCIASKNQGFRNMKD